MAHVGRFLLAAAWQLAAASAEGCSAAGVGRAAFRSREALDYIEAENAKRAPYYLKQAHRLFKKGIRQAKGIDKSNNDPYIASYDAQHQILGALDLSPNNASTWMGAGKATVLLGALDDP